jgi:hypothetical protein
MILRTMVDLLSSHTPLRLRLRISGFDCLAWNPIRRLEVTVTSPRVDVVQGYEGLKDIASRDKTDQ